MDSIFKKLNYKGQKQVFVVNAPESFEDNIRSVASEAEIKRQVKSSDQVGFAIGFATLQTEVDNLARNLAPNLHGDAVFWICYPKAGSRKYKCDFNRDTGWDILGTFDLEPVRQVAIDEDWSALRFRKVAYIKKMTRNEGMILSEKGKEKAKGR